MPKAGVRRPTAEKMNPAKHFVVFTLGGLGYALDIDTVDRIVRSVDITPLPSAPSIVMGIVNVEGQIIPVINMRKRFGIGEKAVSVDDILIVARTVRRQVALLADAVNDVFTCNETDIVAAPSVVPGLEHVAGVLRLPDGMVLLHDLDRFLSLDEGRGLDDALASHGGDG